MALGKFANKCLMKIFHDYYMILIPPCYSSPTPSFIFLKKRSLFCPNEAKGLPDVWGAEFETLYEKYEQEGKARRTMPAQELWFQILSSQVRNVGISYIRIMRGGRIYILCLIHLNVWLFNKG